MNQKIYTRHTTETLKDFWSLEAGNSSWGGSPKCVVQVIRVNQNGFCSICLQNLNSLTP